MQSTPSTAKKATNLTLSAHSLELARELGMNVSQTVDALLQAEVRRRYQEKWRAENKQAIAAYNERVKREGAFGDDIRGF